MLRNNASCRGDPLPRPGTAKAADCFTTPRLFLPVRSPRIGSVPHLPLMSAQTKQ
jgi:hypothetical protein